jgi:hypothetical protein
MAADARAITNSKINDVRFLNKSSPLIVSINLPLKPVTILIIEKYYTRPGYYIFWNKRGSAKK